MGDDTIRSLVHILSFAVHSGMIVKGIKGKMQPQEQSETMVGTVCWENVLWKQEKA
jgi:hypothetical protein